MGQNLISNSTPCQHFIWSFSVDHEPAEVFPIGSLQRNEKQEGKAETGEKGLRQFFHFPPQLQFCFAIYSSNPPLSRSLPPHTHTMPVRQGWAGGLFVFKGEPPQETRPTDLLICVHKSPTSLLPSSN